MSKIAVFEHRTHVCGTFPITSMSFRVGRGRRALRGRATAGHVAPVRQAGGGKVAK
jgi:hypothetical protein